MVTPLPRRTSAAIGTLRLLPHEKRTGRRKPGGEDNFARRGVKATSAGGVCLSDWEGGPGRGAEGKRGQGDKGTRGKDETTAVSGPLSPCPLFPSSPFPAALGAGGSCGAATIS